MKRFLKSFRCGHRGFTLIELLIVIAILGILAVVIVPNIGKFLGKGTLQAANIEVSTVKTAAQAHAIDVGRDVAGTVGPERTSSSGDDGAGIIAYIDGPLKAEYTIATNSTPCIITATNATCDTCWGSALGAWNTTDCEWKPA